MMVKRKLIRTSLWWTKVCLVTMLDLQLIKTTLINKSLWNSHAIYTILRDACRLFSVNWSLSTAKMLSWHWATQDAGRARCSTQWSMDQRAFTFTETKSRRSRLLPLKMASRRTLLLVTPTHPHRHFYLASKNWMMICSLQILLDFRIRAVTLLSL